MYFAEATLAIVETFLNPFKAGRLAAILKEDVGWNSRIPAILKQGGGQYSKKLRGVNPKSQEYWNKVWGEKKITWMTLQAYMESLPRRFRHLHSRCFGILKTFPPTALVHPIALKSWEPSWAKTSSNCALGPRLTMHDTTAVSQICDTEICCMCRLPAENQVA